ncbi:MAG: hypothetical protein ACTSO8_02225 [Promethearchaeota archaeon]
MSLIIFLTISNYKLQIEFDPSASEQQFIIQFLANIILYNNSFGFVYINLTWIIVSLIPILIFSDYKKAYSMNLTTFFFPNFFFYVFYWRYSETYFATLFPTFIIKTIILGITIAFTSITLSLIVKFIKGSIFKANVENLEQIEQLNTTECPKCGTKFDSTPKYCFNCNNLITKELGENIRREK